MANFEIFFFLLGDSSPSNDMFPIMVPPGISVGELKDRVHTKKQNRLTGIDPSELRLWKLKTPIPGNEAEADAGVDALGPKGEKLSEFALLMETVKKLEFYFPSAMIKESIHIVVQAPISTTPLIKSSRKRPAGTDLTDNDAESDGLRVGMQKKRRLDLLDGSNTIYRSESDPDVPSEVPLFPTSSSFDHLFNTPNILAADKTMYIEKLDKNPHYQLMLLRPRRWGKSTFLQMLANYYDLSKAHEFDNIFGQLYIGKNPTKAHNSLLVLLLDFSVIQCDPDKATNQLNSLLLRALKKFLETYGSYLDYPDSESLLGHDGTDALANVLDLVAERKRKVFVGVDEYDAPANAALFSDKIAHYDGISELFKIRFFAVVKQHYGHSIAKYWLTGVLPAFQDGISPLVGVKNISMSPQYNAACGLTEDEVRAIAKAYLSTHNEADLDKELEVMKRWFNGHRFSPPGDGIDVPSLYNPQLVFTHLESVAERAGQVRPDEEANATHTANVFNAIINKDGEGMSAYDLLPLLSGHLKVSIKPEFGPPEVKRIGKSPDITWTLLYHFGVITRGQGDGDELVLPNLTMRRLVTRRFWEYLISIDRPFTKRMTDSCAALIGGDHSLLVRVLEEFFQQRPVRSVSDSNEANLQSLIEICWFETDQCLSELRLVVDPTRGPGEGYGYVDLFVASSPESSESLVPLIELKQVTLVNLCKTPTNPKPSFRAMESVRTELEKEDLPKLLNRSYYYWDKERRMLQKSTISELMGRATQQVKRYLAVAKNGPAKGRDSGVFDSRIICEKGEDSLVAYVVIGIGGTRVIAAQIGVEQTEFSFRKRSTRGDEATGQIPTTAPVL